MIRNVKRKKSDLLNVDEFLSFSMNGTSSQDIDSIRIDNYRAHFWLFLCDRNVFTVTKMN